MTDEQASVLATQDGLADHVEWPHGEIARFGLQGGGPGPSGPQVTGRDAVPVDVAILCVAGFSQVSRNPEHILNNVRPRHLVGGHWEDFFLWPDRKIIRSAPGTSIEEFVRRARGVSPAPIYMVGPGTTLSFPLDGS